MYEQRVGDDAGADLARAAVTSLRSTAAVRSAADAVELQAIATLAQVRRTQAVARARRVAEDRRGGVGGQGADAHDQASTDERAQVDLHRVGLAKVDVDLVDRMTAQEVSLALRLSPVVARDRLETALELVERRPATFEALRTGRIDLLRARRIADAVRHLVHVSPAEGTVGPEAAEDGTAEVVPADVAAEGGPADMEPSDVATLVEAEALCPGSVPRLADLRPASAAGELTPAQLTARLTRLVLRADPAGAVRRTEAADARRGCTLRALPDGMALLSVTGRAELLSAAFTRIDRTARALVAAGRAGAGVDRAAAAGAAGGVATGPRPGVDAARGLEQARVDVLLASLLGRSSDLAAAPGVQVSLAVVAPAATVLAGGDEPGELVGYGPLPAPLVRELAGDADWVRWCSDPLDGQVTAVGRRTYRPSAAVARLVRARDQYCRFPTCRRAAHSCDLDHVVPFPSGSTTPSNLAGLCRLHHLSKHRAGFAVRSEPDGTVIWTTPTGEEVVDHPPSWGRPPPVGDDDLAITHDDLAITHDDPEPDPPPF